MKSSIIFVCLFITLSGVLRPAHAETIESIPLENFADDREAAANIYSILCLEELETGDIIDTSMVNTAELSLGYAIGHGYHDAPYFNVEGSIYSNEDCSIHEFYPDGGRWGYDLEEAARRFGYAAEYGFPIGQLNYGYCLIYGLGIERNVTLGIQYMEAAANGGVGTAAVRLAFVYMDGDVIVQDLEKAHDWLIFARESNAPDDEYNEAVTQYLEMKPN
ncbi:MAG: tetratricopeptide repeat protein [Octadecabacter sp.]